MALNRKLFAGITGALVLSALGCPPPKVPMTHASARQFADNYAHRYEIFAFHTGSDDDVVMDFKTEGCISYLHVAGSRDLRQIDRKHGSSAPSNQRVGEHLRGVLSVSLKIDWRADHNLDDPDIPTSTTLWGRLHDWVDETDDDLSTVHLMCTGTEDENLLCKEEHAEFQAALRMIKDDCNNKNY